MLGGLLGPKFSNKCKHLVKCIKCRMDTIRKKKQAMVRYLKKDVADLISGGYSSIAFGRIDALIFEENQSSCYDMIEQYCCCILEHLPTMQKERVCPEEATEAIATLIFAAARYSDLPELADLRTEFTYRYGTRMEAYINEEFVEKVQKKSFSKDTKLNVMQDIAMEFSIHWDLKAFEHRLSNLLAPSIEESKIHSVASEVAKEMLVIEQGNRIAKPERNRAFNLTPPYIKPAKLTGHGVSSSYGSPLQTRTEDEHANTAINGFRRMQRTFSDQPRGHTDREDLAARLAALRNS